MFVVSMADIRLMSSTRNSAVAERPQCRTMLHVIEYFAKSLKIIGDSTIPSIAHEFLFVFRCNYGHIFYRF